MKIRIIAVSSTAVTRRREKELPIMVSALFSSPFPQEMEKSGAPPLPNRLVKAVTMQMMGKVSPTPVRALAAAPGI